MAHNPKEQGSPERIAEQFGIHAGQVHAALAFYYMHKAEFDEQINRENEPGSHG